MINGKGEQKIVSIRMKNKAGQPPTLMLSITAEILKLADKKLIKVKNANDEEKTGKTMQVSGDDYYVKTSDDVTEFDEKSEVEDGSTFEKEDDEQSDKSSRSERDIFKKSKDSIKETDKKEKKSKKEKKEDKLSSKENEKKDKKVERNEDKKEKKPETAERKDSKSSIISVLEAASPLKGNDYERELADLKQKLKTSKTDEEKKNKLISSLEAELKQYRANDPKKKRKEI